ncbi:amidase, partial [Streptomyces sp. C3-3]|nr:amidase [Streptomyces sp. C3-3]
MSSAEPTEQTGPAVRDPGRSPRPASPVPPPAPGLAESARRLAETLARLGHHVEEARPRYGLIGLAFVPRATVGIAEFAARHP